jgi:outer membrane protein assembly factor BamA
MLPALTVAVLLASAPDAPFVRAVRIEASEAERRRLERYVEVSPGERLDAERLRHAVELIYATGDYADVRVELEPAADGVGVVVRPVPGPLLAAVRVQGDAPIDAGGIRELTRLRSGEPLWPQRLEGAAQAVATHLSDEGYPQARVAAEAVGEAEGTDAVFRIQAGPRAHVVQIAVEGEGPRDAFLSLARPRVGEVWRRVKAREAAEEMRRLLVREGRWRASVAAVDSYDATTAAVRLLFRVDRGPRVEVAIPDEAGGRRGEIETLLRENGAKSDAVDEAVDRIEEALRLLGHRDARVTSREEVASDHLRLVFDVEAGPVTRAASVRVMGDATVPAVALLTRPGEPLRDRTLDEDVRALSRALEDAGYGDARVDADVPDSAGSVPVVFRLRAGPRTEITSVDVVSPIALGGGPARELRSRAGRPYRVRDLVGDRNTLLALYHNAGYLQADVTSDLAFSEDRTGVAIRLRVVPGPQTRVDHIVIAGLTHTREEIVRREMQLQEADPLGVEAVLESQRRLGSLGVFGNVSISEIDPESIERRSLVVSVEELPRIRVAYGFGYSEREGPRLSAEVTRRNLGGRDRSLTTFVRGSFRGLRFFTTYREPYLLGRRQELFVTGFREEEERDTFDYVRYGLSVEAARRLSASWSLIARLTTQNTRSFDLKVPVAEIDRQYLNAVFSGPSLSLVHDGRDDPLDPRRGIFVTADTQFSHRVLGGDSFLKGFVQASHYRRLGTQMVLATNGRLGLARTLEGEEGPEGLPFPDRFYTGGDYSVRGFKQDFAGPLDTSVENRPLPTGGNALVLASAELRVNAGRYFSVAGFTDAGHVYPLASDIDLRDVRYSAGVGLRYKSAFGPIRVDWAYKLNRRDEASRSRVHFTIGHAF